MRYEPVPLLSKEEILRRIGGNAVDDIRVAVLAAALNAAGH